MMIKGFYYFILFVLLERLWFDEYVVNILCWNLDEFMYIEIIELN